MLNNSKNKSTKHVTKGNAKKTASDGHRQEYTSKYSEISTQKSPADTKKSNKPSSVNSEDSCFASLKVSRDEPNKFIDLSPINEKTAEKDLKLCNDYNKQLEKQIKTYQAQLLEKENILSRYSSEMRQMKREIERLVGPITGVNEHKKQSASLFCRPDIDIDEAYESNDWHLSGARSPRYYENEVSRLQSQLKETQQLYQSTSHKLKELSEKFTKQELEFFKYKSSQVDGRGEQSKIRSESDPESRSIRAELAVLRKLKDEQESAKIKQEQKHKEEIDKLANELKGITEVYTKLKEEKESEVLQLKNEIEEKTKQLKMKEMRIADLTANLSKANSEIKNLKSIYTPKKPDPSSQIIQDLTEKNAVLQDKLKDYQAKSLNNFDEHKVQVKNIVQQLSNIILSRDRAGTTETKDLKRNLSRILVENSNVFEVILNDYFGKDYSSLKEIMQQKTEELEETIECLHKEHKNLLSELDSETSKRKEIFSRLQHLEKEVNNKIKDSDLKNQRAISSGPELFKNLLDNDYSEKRQSNRKRNTKTTENSEQDDLLKKNLFQAVFNTESDMLFFLQCEAAALESFLIGPDD